MDLQAIRNVIVQGLHQYTSRPVVMLEQNKHKPDYPFLAYQITTPYVKGFGHDVETRELVESNNPSFEYDFEEKKLDQPTFTISFTAYSFDSLESQQLALQARDWLNHIAYYELKRLGVVVVSIEAIGNRDTLIIDDYERRNGFDVIFRATSEATRRLETIEEWSMEGEIK